MNIPRPTAALPGRSVPGVLLLLLACSLSAIGFAAAAPPPGHPSPGAAMHIMRPEAAHAPGAKRVGVALDAIDANEYTYIEVDEAGKTYWIATARMKIERGDMVEFEEGVTMDRFHSKLLKRTFPSVMFVGGVATTAGGK